MYEFEQKLATWHRLYLELELALQPQVREAGTDQHCQSEIRVERLRREVEIALEDVSSVAAGRALRRLLAQKPRPSGAAGVTGLQAGHP